MNRLKLKISFLMLFLLVTSLAAAPTAQAQNSSNGFSFQSVFESIKNQTQRFYLRVVPGPKSGQAVLQQSLVEMEKTDTFQLNSDVQVNLVYADNSVEQLTSNITGPVQVTNIYEPDQYQLQLVAEGFFAPSGQPKTEENRAAAEMITHGGDSYLKIHALPSLGGDFELPELTDQWIVFNETIEQAEVEISPEEEQQLQAASVDLLKNAQVSEANKENRDGVDVFVINVTLPDEALLNYLDQVSQITGGDVEQNFDREQTAQLLAESDTITATVWIDRGSFHLRHLESRLGFAGETIAVADPLSSTQRLNRVEVNLVVNMTDFNQPVEITAPEGARQFEEVMGEMMGNMMGFGQGPMMDFTLDGNLGDSDQAVDSDGEVRILPMPMDAPDSGSAGSTEPAYPGMTEEQRLILEQYGY